MSAQEAGQQGRRRLLLGCILATAFALRLAWRLHTGEADFWRNGYGFFYDMGWRLAHGGGLSTTSGGWAVRQPAYPAFLALTALAGRHYLLIVVPEALFGVLTAFCAYLIGRRLFDQRAGLIAAALAAIYPYYVVHDTALQDTSMADAGAALAVYVLMRARTARSPWAWLAAGALCGLIVLIRGTLLPFAVGAMAWIAIAGAPPRRLARAGVVALACVLVLGAWMTRNYVRIGHPVLSSQIGEEFWWANGPYTFSHYPTQSMDLSAAVARDALSPVDRRTLAAMTNEADRSDWYMARGWAYAARHPADIAVGVLRKEAAGFSWVLNPVREPAVQALYFVSYAPVLLLGLAGVVLWGRNWRECGLIYLQFLGFMLVTAVFWAHTSHRVYLDVYLMIFAAPLIGRLADWARGWASRRSAAYGVASSAAQPP